MVGKCDWWQAMRVMVAWDGGEEWIVAKVATGIDGGLVLVPDGLSKGCSWGSHVGFGNGGYNNSDDSSK